MDHELPAAVRPTEITHPDEIKASVTLRMGSGSFAATARVTPAGLVAAGILTSAILLSVGPLIRAAKK